MKKAIFILIIILSLNTQNIFSQCSGNLTNSVNNTKATSIGIIIYSDNTETVWNALRFANFSVNKGDTVNIFLLGKGVELDNLAKTDENIKEQTELFLNNKGVILGCGTCLKSRNNNDPKICKFSSMSDLYDLVRKNKIVMTF